MPSSTDFLSLTLLLILGAIILTLHFRYNRPEKESPAETQDVFYHQHELDPISMRLPVTGLERKLSYDGTSSYLPEVMRRLLFESDGDERASLAAFLGAGSPARAGEEALFQTWIVGLFVVLLGLVAIFIWLLSFL